MLGSVLGFTPRKVVEPAVAGEKPMLQFPTTTKPVPLQP